MISWQPGMSLEEIEKQCVLQAFRFYRGNKTQCAIALGIAIRTLDSKLEKYEHDGKQQRNADDARAIEARKQRDRARGVGFQVKEENESSASSADAGLHMESTAQASAQYELPVSKRQEVQSVLPKHTTASGQGRRR